MSFKEMVNELKKNSKQLNEPFVFAIDTEKSIFLPVKAEGEKEKVAVVGIKLDKNLDPVKDENGNDVKIAIIVDDAPQKEGKIQDYYKNMTEEDLEDKAAFVRFLKRQKNPETQIGASVILFHEVKRLDSDQNVKDSEGGVFPTYTASRYCNRIGIDAEQAKTRIMHGIRTKLNIKRGEGGKEEYFLNAFDVDNQVQFDDAKNSIDGITKQLGDFYDLMCAKYKDQAYNKSFVCVSVFADIDGTKKRLGREEKTETGESKYVTSPIYLRLFQKIKENDKTVTEVLPKEKFVADSINWIEEFIEKFPVPVSITMMPRYFLRCDNLAPENGKIPSKLAEMLSSGFYDLSILTSANRTYKGIQLYQRDEQPIPYATIDSKDNVAPVAEYDEYLEIVNSQETKIKQAAGSEDNEKEDPNAIPGYF